ncbi:hypothetical protein BV25DRAFT_1825251 [Artomyces pyxidatus]|uniref:Uncharacterized protein n=1 Tax=Artomyces pyxidatus TaxID=48021 RepID=A0ACB8T2M9_9AGAM|nr:hypothetical protein BV25DRAFT_1825251 [Artomyces pyxidatus]
MPARTQGSATCGPMGVSPVCTHPIVARPHCVGACIPWPSKASSLAPTQTPPLSVPESVRILDQGKASPIRDPAVLTADASLGEDEDHAAAEWLGM